jgi:chromosomal replication initiation ATPase DnaA
MLQQGLDLIPRLPYVPKKFIVHSGAVKIVDASNAALNFIGFSSQIFCGHARSGKTHASIFLQDLTRQNNFIPTYLDGRDLNNFFSNIAIAREWTDHDCIIIDDAHEYFLQTLPGQSGAFVDFYEMCRRKGVKLFMFSLYNFEKLPCDDHIKSRLNASLAGNFTPPLEQELGDLIEAMAWQRGIKIGTRQRKFIDKRVKREISAIENYFSRLLHLSRLFGAKLGYGLLNDAV